MKFDNAERVYSFDVENSRMLDSWWHLENPDEIVMQSLRCYTVDEISSMCENAGLAITGIFPEVLWILVTGHAWKRLPCPLAYPIGFE